jgi:4-cresol dehydrogenase (hydroxylating)
VEAQARDALIGIVGATNVVDDAASLGAASTATYATDHRITTIVRPADAEQVAAVLRLAQAESMAVYPVSAGKNWGYGSRTPANDAAVLLDLSGMDAIIEVDDELGTATVEPGVTFRQLAAVLAEQGNRWFLSVPGTTPDASLIGNLVERGWGFGPYSDRFANSCGLQVVLPDGEIVETGHARFPGSRSAAAYRWGAGPSTDGLFTQSNLGVVTRATIFLAPVPPHYASFLYHVDDEDRFEGLVDALRGLRMAGIIRTNFKVQNTYRMLMERERLPLVTGDDQAILPDERITELKQQHGLGTWNGLGALYCWSDEQLRAEEAIVRAALEPWVDAIVFLDEHVIQDEVTLQASIKADTGYDISRLRDHYYDHTRMLGNVTGKGVHGAYWRMPDPSPSGQPYDESDLDTDRVGFIWVDPIVPFTGHDMREAAALAASVQAKHGFEPNLGFNCVTERAVTMTLALVYNRDQPGSDERAGACARELAAAMQDAGFSLGRLTTLTMDVLDGADAGSRTMQAKIKAALDPNGVLAPGRYE